MTKNMYGLLLQSQVHNALQTIWFSIKIGLGPQFSRTVDTSQRFHHTGAMQHFQHVGEWNSFAMAAALQTLQTQYYDITEFASVCENGDVVYWIFLSSKPTIKVSGFYLLTQTEVKSGTKGRTSAFFLSYGKNSRHFRGDSLAVAKKIQYSAV